MALNSYKCLACSNVEKFFSHEKRVCKTCSQEDQEKFKKILGIPLSNKITDKVDKYHNVDAEKGIQDDCKTRSKQHVQDTLDDMIGEFGEQIAKEQGWIVWDETKKRWRKRTNWDTGVLNKQNKGSASALKGKK